MKKMIKQFLKRIKWYDISLIKLSTLLFTLFLVGIWESFRAAILRVNPHYFLILGLLICIPICKKMFIKETTSIFSK